MNVPLGNPKGSQGPPGSTWPEELIALGPGESAWQVVLKKIQELSDSVWREKEGGVRVEGSREQRGRISVPTLVDEK